MNFSTFSRNLEQFFHLRKDPPKISIIIPFSSDNKIRKKNLKWLLQYWKHELPNAEIVIGVSKNEIFCKGEAINDALEKCKGKIIVLIDADALISGKVVEHCANRILEEMECGNKLWYVPYRRLYRLNEQTSNKIINSDPSDPYFPLEPIPIKDLSDKGDKIKYGHYFGAMAMIFPMAAYEAIGCFDEKFAGWGGEDISFLKTFDVIWGKNKTTNTPIFHLYHPFIGIDHRDKRWENQNKINSNSELTIRYYRATGDPSRIKVLNEEAIAYRKAKNS